MENTINVFTDGIISDMHPLTTLETLLTDALNATFITFNGNEMLLQNDMGNTTILDDEGNNICLSKGFVPVGMKEHGGILYIASVNKEGVGEIGTIPSPKITFEELYKEEISVTEEINKNLSLSNIFKEAVTTKGKINNSTLLLDNKLYYAKINNNIKLSDTTVKLGDSYVIYLDETLFSQNTYGFPLISTFLKNGKCNNDGWFNVCLKSKTANSNLPISVGFTTLYPKSEPKYWFTSEEPDKEFVYQQYPNIPKGKLMLDISINLPTEVEITLPEYQENDSKKRYKCLLPEQIIKDKNYFGPLKINANYIKLISTDKGIIENENDKDYLYIKNSNDLTVELEISCYHYLKELSVFIPLGIYRIKYNPIRQIIIDDVDLVPATTALQLYYDALNPSLNLYDELETTKYILIPKKRTDVYQYSHAHLIAKNDNRCTTTEIKDASQNVIGFETKLNTDLNRAVFFIPGAAYVDENEETPIIANYNEFALGNMDFAGYYTGSRDLLNAVCPFGRMNEIIPFIYKPRVRTISDLEYLLSTQSGVLQKEDVKRLLLFLEKEIFIKSLPLFNGTYVKTVYHCNDGDFDNMFVEYYDKNTETFNISTAKEFVNLYPHENERPDYVFVYFSKLELYLPTKRNNYDITELHRAFASLYNSYSVVRKEYDEIAPEMMMAQAIAMISEIGFLNGNNESGTVYEGIVPLQISKDDAHYTSSYYYLYKLPRLGKQKIENCILYDPTEYTNSTSNVNVFTKTRGYKYNLIFTKSLEVFSEDFKNKWKPTNYLFESTPSVQFYSDHIPTLLVYSKFDLNEGINLTLNFNGEEKTIKNSGFVKFNPFKHTVFLNDTIKLINIESQTSISMFTNENHNYHNYAWGFSSNLNLLYSLENVPQTGKATRQYTKIYPQWNFKAYQNVNHEGKVINVDYTMGWEFNVDETPDIELYKNDRTINILYAALKSGNNDLPFKPLSSNNVEGKYAVIFNGYAEKNTVYVNYFDGLSLKSDCKFDSNSTINIINLSGINVNDGSFSVMCHINTLDEKNYVRNIGIYKIIDDTVIDKQNIVVLECICFDEDNTCGLKTYKMRHYSNDPKIKTYRWYRIDDDRTKIFYIDTHSNMTSKLEQTLEQELLSKETKMLKKYLKIGNTVNISDVTILPIKITTNKQDEPSILSNKTK